MNGENPHKTWPKTVVHHAKCALNDKLCNINLKTK